MIQFQSEEVRTQFHLLPIDLQKWWNDQARSLAKTGSIIIIRYVEEIIPGQLEACVRIVKEFDIGIPCSNMNSYLLSLC